MTSKIPPKLISYSSSGQPPVWKKIKIVCQLVLRLGQHQGYTRVSYKPQQRPTTATEDTRRHDQEINKDMTKKRHTPTGEVVAHQPSSTSKYMIIQ